MCRLRWFTNILLLYFIVFSFSIARIGAQSDTCFTLNNVTIKIAYPIYQSEKQKTILVLPGWNFSYDDICIKSNFCELAQKKGFILILPDMKKSVYQSTMFPETRSDWRIYKTRSWVIDTLIPFIQHHFNLLLKNQSNYLFGISTGGRGVALIAADEPDIFKAGAALSGDFDQTLIPNDNLMKGYYGSYQQFADRWKSIDNPVNLANKIKIPLYLAHGKNDNIVPYTQSVVFYEKLIKYNKQLKHQLLISNDSGHDYNFWSSQYENIFQFFENMK